MRRTNCNREKFSEERGIGRGGRKEGKKLERRRGERKGEGEDIICLMLKKFVPFSETLSLSVNFI